MKIVGKIISGVYKTISYKFISDGKLLVIVLPRAGAKFASHRELINELGRFGSVLFLESGYFGISKAGNDLEDITIDRFRVYLHELVTRLGLNKVILVSESVGAIHALNYASFYNEEVELLVVSNPALYKPRWIYGLLIVPILDLGIKISPDGLLKGLGKLLKKLPKNDMKGLGDTFLSMNQTIGSLSYLSCLKEIVDFKNRYESDDVKNVLNKTYVLIGKNDKAFRLLCNKNYCANCVHYKEIPSAGHGIIDSNPDEVMGIFRKIFGVS